MLRKLGSASERLGPFILIFFIYQAINAPMWGYVILAAFTALIVAAIAVTWNDKPQPAS